MNQDHLHVILSAIEFYVEIVLICRIIHIPHKMVEIPNASANILI